MSRCVGRVASLAAVTILLIGWSVQPSAIAQEGPVTGDGAAGVLKIRTIPRIQGVRFRLNGRVVSTNERGVLAARPTEDPSIRPAMERIRAEVARLRAQVEAADHQSRSVQNRLRELSTKLNALEKKLGTHSLEFLGMTDASRGIRATFGRWCCMPISQFDPSIDRLTIPLESLRVALNIEYLVSQRFTDLQGQAIPADDVSSLVVKSSIGVRHRLAPGEPTWLLGARVIPDQDGLSVKHVQYSVEGVGIRGANVVNRAQQRFYPARDRLWNLELLFYPARFRIRDAFFGFPIGSTLRLEYPDGSVEEYPVSSQGNVEIEALPRGEYSLSVEGPGLSLSAPVSLTRSQDLDVIFLSYWDLTAALLLFGFFTVGLVMIGRPQARRKLLRRTLSGVGPQPPDAPPAPAMAE